MVLVVFIECPRVEWMIKRAADVAKNSDDGSTDYSRLFVAAELEMTVLVQSRLCFAYNLPQFIRLFA